MCGTWAVSARAHPSTFRNLDDIPILAEGHVLPVLGPVPVLLHAVLCSHHWSAARALAVEWQLGSAEAFHRHRQQGVQRRWYQHWRAVLVQHP